MPKSRFGPRTVVLYVGGVVPVTREALQGPLTPSPAVLQSHPWSLGPLGASHSTPQSCRALARKDSLHGPLLLSRGAAVPQGHPQSTGLHWGHASFQHCPPGMSSPLLPGQAGTNKAFLLLQPSHLSQAPCVLHSVLPSTHLLE